MYNENEIVNKYLEDQNRIGFGHNFGGGFGHGFGGGHGFNGGFGFGGGIVPWLILSGLMKHPYYNSPNYSGYNNYPLYPPVNCINGNCYSNY